MSGDQDESNGDAIGRVQARAGAARLLLDVLIERDLTPAQRSESLALLTEILASPLARRTTPSSRHPSVSQAIVQLGQLDAQLRPGSGANTTPDGAVGWECALVGNLGFTGTPPVLLSGMTLGGIAGSCPEIHRAIDWYLPFRDVAWNGLRLTGQPAFCLGDGRFIGYSGRAEAERSKPAAPDSPSPDEEARLAHEVRSPLGAIVGFADMIVQQSFGPAPAEMGAAAQRILETGAKLLSALDDMTDAARLDLGRYPVDLGWIDARLVMDRAVARFASLAADRQAALRAVGGQPLWMQVDEQAMQRLVDRLIAGILGLADPQEVFELEARPIAGDRVSLALSRPACLAGWTSDELRNSSIEIDSPVVAGRAVPMVGLGFALRLVTQLAERLGGSFVAEPDRFVVILPALHAIGVASRARAT